MYSASSSTSDHQAIYLTGGEKADGSGLGYAEVWSITISPQQDAIYTAFPPLPTDLLHHQSVLLSNGTLLLLGGYIPSTSQFLSMDKAYVLDTNHIGTASWRTAGSLGPSAPRARRGHTASLIITEDGTEKIILIGGTSSLNPSASESGEGKVLDDIWILDPARGAWQEIINDQSVRIRNIEEDLSEGKGLWRGKGKRAVSGGPGGRYDHIAQVIGGQVVVFGGYTSSGPADSGIYIWDTESSKWSDTFRPVSVSSSNPASQTSASPSGSTTAHSSGQEKVSSVIGSRSSTATTKNSMKTSVQTSGSSRTSTTGTMNTPPSSPATSARHNVIGIAVGCSLAGIALVLGGIFIFCCIRRKKRKAREGRALLLTPFGGRPSHRKRSRRVVNDDGGEGPWNVPEKDDDLVFDDDGGDDYTMERKGYHIGEDEDRDAQSDEGFSASGPVATKKTSTLVGLGKPSASPGAGIAAKIRQVSDRIVSNSRRGGRGGRFSMLEDEDKEDLLWKGEEGEEGVTEDSESVHENGSHHDDQQEKGLPILPPKDRQSRGIKPSLVTPTRDDLFSDHLDEYYDSNIISYVDGNSLGRRPAGPTTKSSANSRESMTESMLTAGDAIQQVARRVSMKTAEASYLPVKRRDSWMQRVAGRSVASLFRVGKTSSTSLHPEQGFLDPTTPPVLDSIREDSYSRTARNGFMSNFGNSVSSFVSAATTNTALLDRYNQMDIMQRDTSGSSSYVPAHMSESATIARNAGLPPVPMKRDMNRPVTPPRGPRPAPLRLPSHIDIGSGAARRPVRDIAASINHRGSVPNEAIPPSPSEEVTTRPTASYMDSPSRRFTSPPAGPRRQTVYQAVPKVPLVIANHS
ncbi:hypothetical protein QFC21_006643 [Naganishia friedmannii]|uniref:Uncharacterized protein n=1 Tax=Naganishia friedmannii TaxID=89922 RepID=A0ACC2V1N8_9TREE|nr:hypothetical protein QFC21_006643 [Naganishia friedmannii]